MIVAPVAVKQDTISKKASTKVGVVLVRYNGIAPNREIDIHVMDTIVRPSLTDILLLPFLILDRRKPIESVSIIVIPKAKAFPAFVYNSIKKEGISSKDSIISM